MTPPAARRMLVLGYGNPGRRDDGLGPALAAAVEAMALPGVDVEASYQLNIEDAATLADYAGALFVDAGVQCGVPCTLRKIGAARTITFTSHAVSPESVLAICEENFGPPPAAWILAIRGYDFELGEGLTPEAGKNLDGALAAALTLIDTWRTGVMDATDVRKKTILTIDDDADIRAALRVVLQAEGFSVGEAVSGEEGLRVAKDIQPDAIVVDLMMEKVDSGQSVVRELRESGYDRPIYLLSSAGDTVRYTIDARAMGLTGIFQKPIDPRALVETLKASLSTG